MARKRELTQREKESKEFQVFFENFLRENGLGAIFFDDVPPQNPKKTNRTKTKQKPRIKFGEMR